MRIIKYPTAESVDSAVKYDAQLIAAVSYSGETAVVAPAEAVFDHRELLEEFGVGVQSFFCIRFGSKTADWVFECPNEYKYLNQRNEQVSEYYRDGLRIIPEFLMMFGYFSKLNILNAPTDIWDF